MHSSLERTCPAINQVLGVLGRHAGKVLGGTIRGSEGQLGWAGWIFPPFRLPEDPHGQHVGSKYLGRGRGTKTEVQGGGTRHHPNFSQLLLRDPNYKHRCADAQVAGAPWSNPHRAAEGPELQKRGVGERSGRCRPWGLWGSFWQERGSRVCTGGRGLNCVPA